MFNFHRTNEGIAEIYEILLAEDANSDFADRFGSAIRFSHRENKYHEVGYLVAIPDKEEQTVKILLCCKKGLTEDDKRNLYEEMELLLGKAVYKIGAEEAEGWFLHDELSDL